MDIAGANCRPNSQFYYFSRTGSILLLNQNHPSFVFIAATPHSKLKRRRLIFRASSSSATPNGSTWLQRLSQSVLRDWEHLLDNLKKETGFDLDDANVKVSGFVQGATHSLTNCQTHFHRFTTHSFPSFLDWHKWDRWKDIKGWEAKRVGALALYVLVMLFSCQRLYVAVRSPVIRRERKQVLEAYMETLIPDPTPTNITKFKKGIWRKTTPKGLKLKKFVERQDGTIAQDSSYVGEDAWDDDISTPQINAKEIFEHDVNLSTEEKKALQQDLVVSGVSNQEHRGTWRERLQAWKAILRKEKLAEQLDSLHAKYVVEFDMKEVENSLRKDVVEKVKATEGTRGLWISKRWWHYRPKLPYTYFLQKLNSSEVAAVVFTEDLKRLYVTMKEGFPLEYIVDIPLDPYLFEIISNSGVEVDLLQKCQIHYFLKFVFAILPAIVILCSIRESVRFIQFTSKRFLHKKYNTYFDMAYAENFIQSVGEANVAKSMYKEVVLGGDIWDLLEELMLYMGNSMLYYEKDVKFMRGVLLSGPPGTGKTLFARALAKRSGMPFVFASGAEFTDNEKSGVVRINEMFATARQNAPTFIFVDEIDAIAGRHARKDPRRSATFDALITQLDGEKERIGVDRFSLKQAVIFICATNRPDELDPEFLVPGRIDRRVYIGLPDANQRVQIFGVHSKGRQLAEDVEFEKLVFRTVGYSGADIRNLVNEAAIMSVRKAHPKICQQDIVDVLDKQLLEGMGVLLTEEEQQKCERSIPIEKKRLLAVHEAGHILLAHLLPQFDGHAFSQLLPGGKETAISVFYPREEMVDEPYMTFGYLKMQMVVAHGGRCAERIVFGNDITDGGRDDLKKITKLAREMVISPGNSRLGLTAVTRKVGMADKPEALYGQLIKYKWDNPRIVPGDMTLEVSELFTRELTRYIDETEELAMNGLMANRHILDMITKELLEKSRITGLEVEERIRGLLPQLIEDFAEDLINPEQEGPLPHSDRLHYRPLDIYPAPLHRC